VSDLRINNSEIRKLLVSYALDIVIGLEVQNGAVRLGKSELKARLERMLELTDEIVSVSKE